MTAPKTIAADGLLSPTEVAKLLDAHRSTVWLWIRNGMLKSEAHGHFHGVAPESLKLFLQSYRPSNGLVAADLDGQIVKLKAAKKPAKGGKKKRAARARGRSAR